jgi:hypothetical protein
MNQHNFSEDDKEKLIEFLNFIAKHMTLGRKDDFGVEESLKFTRLLSFMQQVLLPKVHENILEVKRIVEAKPEPEKEAPKKRGRKKA